ncbi:Cyclic nucleotide-gated cation channel subunit A [Durusdinium trenchii]|uniref:Cyclic nucleotide-gated cation channel subunit A n=1 Tax=Durusdinium trenchii TaxID=1381693 RepID=A0ABP0Q8D7_9DINO
MFDINAEVDNLINVVSVAIFVYWVLDVPATFITGFDRAGILEMRIHEIVLVLDVMIFVVLSFNTESESGSNDSMGSFRLARALRLMRFLRLLRLHKMANLAAEILDRFKTDSFLLTMNILRSLAAVLALNHYMSCAFLGLALLFAAEGELTWIEIAELQHMDFLTQYFSALHWSLTQFMPATNNIAPNTAPERIYAIFVVLIGLAVFSSFAAWGKSRFGSEPLPVNQLRQIHTEHFKQESRMKSFLTQKSVSVDVWCRVQKFCRLRILLDKMSLKEGDIPMLQDLPHGLRVKLHAEIYMPILVSANWMPSDVTEIDEELMLKLCDKVLLEKVASPMQEIFLERGECPEVGTWLCELSLWARWEYRGQLDTEEVSHYVVIPAQEFALAVTKAGLLYIAKAESQDANCDGIPLTDLPLLSESDAQAGVLTDLGLV